jgi:hypothetical protein
MGGHSRQRTILLLLVAVAEAAAAGVHYYVMPEHFDESALYGSFFLVAATVQLGFARWLLVRPSRRLIAVSTLGNAAIVVLWLITRSIAIPLGPDAGTTEPFGGLDTFASTAEIVAAAAGLTLLYSERLRVRHAVMEG